MTKYLHSLSMASYTGQKYAYYFKKRAQALDYSKALSMNHFYQGFIGRSSKVGKFINTKVIDTPSGLVGLLSTFSESPWLNLQYSHNIMTLAEGRDLFNPKVAKKPLNLTFIKEPEPVFVYGVNYGTPYNVSPYINYLYQGYEAKGIAQSILGNYASSALANMNQGEKRTRSIRHYFIEQATKTKQTPYSLAHSNLKLEIFESAFESMNIYFTSRYSKKAISPNIITSAFALSGEYGRFFGNTCITEMPDPSEKDYLEGAGRAEILSCFINAAGSFNLLVIGINDDDFFFLEKWEDNDWTDHYYGESPEDEAGKMLGWLPNTLGEPIGVMLKDHCAIYVSGIRAHYYEEKEEKEEGGNGEDEEEQEQEKQITLKAQTATIKLIFEYKEKEQSLSFKDTELIEHDASGTSKNYEDLGGTDKDYWNIYHTLWGANVNNHAVVLVNNTRHKRSETSRSNFMGDSVEDEEDIKNFIHLYIDDKVYPFDCEQLGFYPDITNTRPLFDENQFDPRYADIVTPLISKKFGSVISDSDILFCMTAYPKKDKTILVKFNINNQSFDIIRTDPIKEGQAVATCYQKQTNKSPACILYRIGTQGQAGKVFLSKDTAKTWTQIADSQYTSGGGMYYLGGDQYSVNYGAAFNS